VPSGQETVIVARILAVSIKLKVLPTAFPVPRDKACNRRRGNDGKRDALLDIGGVLFHRAEEIGAHRAGALALWAEYSATGAP
jgi:hypothetical protein